MVSVPKSDEWVISFHMRVPRAGFHWSPEAENGEWYLQSNYSPLGLDFEHREGLQAGRDVMSKFRTLGRSLNERFDLAYDDDQVKEWVLDVANAFGPLYERPGPDETLSMWVDAATEFADICDVRDALNSGIFDEFRKRILIRRDGMHYRRSNQKKWLFAPTGIDWQGSPGELRVNLFDHAVKKGAHQQAWGLITYVVNKQMRNGLSLSLNPIRINKPTIEASGVLANAYVRLWLYVVHRESIDLEAPHTCRECGIAIVGTRRKQFCSDRCRKAFNRKRSPA